MPLQEFPFNGDTFVQAEFLKLRDKYKIKTIVETGTCVGSTAKWFGENFNRVFTVELVAQYRNFALRRILESEQLPPAVMGEQHQTIWFLIKDKLTNNGTTKIKELNSFLGDSVEMLRSYILPRCKNDTMLFLDAHWGDFCPLQEELMAIAEFKLKPVIVIHDFLVPDHPELGYDFFKEQPFTYEWLKPCFDAIYGEGGYTHYYNSQATEIKRGLIYVVPNLKPIKTAKNPVKRAVKSTKKASKRPTTAKKRKPRTK
jgi:hypothetical protein